jgi:hypothetical protein
VNPRREAELYTTALFAGQPEGSLIVVSIAPDWGKPHFVKAPADVLDWTVGTVDAFVRPTPVTHRPRRGRGDDSLAAALAGVACDIDVDGSPDGKGGTVEGAAESLDAAQELAHGLLEPTMAVCSGYGLQPYWLFREPIALASEADRAAARDFLCSWHAAMRALAQAAGMRKFDTVSDLSRVLRVPGSLNGKGPRPVPVELLDDGGPRYELDELRAHIDRNGPGPSAGADGGEGRTAGDILGRYPKLARIAHREGKPPGDASPSAWDWFLICEARRRVNPPLGNEEAIALLAHVRRLHREPKAERDDYLERTVDKAFAEVDAPVDDSGPEDGSPEAIGRWISEQWRLDPGNPIVDGRAVGYGGGAILYLTRRDGSRLRFPRMADLFDAAAHVRQVSIVARARCPSFGRDQAVRIAQALVELCDVRDDPDEGRMILGDLLSAFVDRLASVAPGELLEPGQKRFDALVAVVDFKPDPLPREVAQRTVAIRDAHRRLWIPADALMGHLRYDHGERVDWTGLTAAMGDLGWERREVEQWEPGVERGDARHIARVFYVEPERLSRSVQVSTRARSTEEERER